MTMMLIMINMIRNQSKIIILLIKTFKKMKIVIILILMNLNKSKILLRKLRKLIIISNFQDIHLEKQNQAP